MFLCVVAPQHMEIISFFFQKMSPPFNEIAVAVLDCGSVYCVFCLLTLLFNGPVECLFTPASFGCDQMFAWPAKKRGMTLLSKKSMHTYSNDFYVHQETR